MGSVATSDDVSAAGSGDASVAPADEGRARLASEPLSAGASGLSHIGHSPALVKCWFFSATLQPAVVQRNAMAAAA